MTQGLDIGEIGNGSEKAGYDIECAAQSEIGHAGLLEDNPPPPGAPGPPGPHGYTWLSIQFTMRDGKHFSTVVDSECGDIRLSQEMPKMFTRATSDIEQGIAE